jgi:putative addiction module component (TIGR02574 family)
MEQAQIFDAAFSLPDESRADLAFQLLQTLKPSEGLSEDDPAFADELERRVQAYESGQTTADEWDAVAGRLQRELEQKGP